MAQEDQLTRGQRTRAVIHNLSNGDKVECMFNPSEYTLTKRNTWKAAEQIGNNGQIATFEKGGSQILRLTLHFDTQMQKTDVRTITDLLWKMMAVDEQNANRESSKAAPPEVAFEWERFYFRSVITKMSQKFTLFLPEGTPVRCQVDITLEQKNDISDYNSESPVQQVINDAAQDANDAVEEAVANAQDRVDNVVADSSGDDLGTEMRRFLEKNNIDDPLKLIPGNRYSR